MKTKNGMHICLATSLVLATSMQVDVHSIKAVEGDHVKSKVVKVNYVEADYKLEDDQILHMKNEVRKQEYIRQQQQLIEAERKRKELERQRIERERQREQQRIEKEKEQNKQMYFEITAYTAGYESTQKHKGDVGYGITASGAPVKEGVTIACPPSFKFGTRMKIEGVGIRICQDRGGAIKAGHIDLYMSSLSAALDFGRKRLLVEILK